MKFKKTLNPIDIWGLALGSIIGWGCFVLPSSFLDKAGPMGTTLGVFIGAIIISLIAINYGYLIKEYPVAGGEFFYALKMFGKKHALLCGWFLILAYTSIIALNATALGMIGRYLFPGVIQKGLLYSIAGWEVYAGELLVGIIFIILFAIFNIRGVKIAGWIQKSIVLILVGTVFIITGVTFAKGVSFNNLSPGFPEGKSIISAVGAIVAMSPWLYIGFDCIPQAVEEYNFSVKKSVLILLIAIFFGGLLYILLTFVTAVPIQWQELLEVNQFWATGEAVRLIMGQVGLVLLGIAMFCAVISGINGFYIATSRLMYSMAQNKALPGFFGDLDKKFATPKKSIIFIMAVSIIAPFLGREVLEWIVDMTSVSAAIAYLYTSASAVKLAKQKSHKRQYWIGFIGSLLSVIFLLLLLVPGMPGYLSNQSMIMLIIWCVLGGIFYIRVKDEYLKEDIDEDIANLG